MTEAMMTWEEEGGHERVNKVIFIPSGAPGSQPDLEYVLWHEGNWQPEMHHSSRLHIFCQSVGRCTYAKIVWRSLCATGHLMLIFLTLELYHLSVHWVSRCRKNNQRGIYRKEAAIISPCKHYLGLPPHPTHSYITLCVYPQPTIEFEV